MSFLLSDSTEGTKAKSLKNEYPNNPRQPFQVELRKFVIAQIRPRVSLCNVSLRSKKCYDNKTQNYLIFHSFRVQNNGYFIKAFF